MLTIIVPGDEIFDEEKQEFSSVGDVVLELEHSLVSLSKWESEFCKPFLAKGEKTTEETIGYVKAMVLGSKIPPEVFSRLTSKNFEDINEYLATSQTATWFSEVGSPEARGSEIITSELIYYWLVAFQIPFEVETWYLNRVFTLIKICNVKNAKPRELSRAELAARNRELNRQRREANQSRG